MAGKRRVWSRREFFRNAGTAAVAGAAVLAVGADAWAKTGAYATVIDITRCDGCVGEAVPRCVAACRRRSEPQFPRPEKPIRDLWPQRFHEDWSSKRDVISRLTPYNWLTVQRVVVDGKSLFVPRRCMHCDNPPCVNLCPFGALAKFDDASVVIDHGLCLGGAKCKAVCPWQIPMRQSGVGVYLHLHPVPAGGGVMYKCDLCRDRIVRGGIPACVEACAGRLGSDRPLWFGTREEMVRRARSRAAEAGGSLYGETENGGTATLYVSAAPFAAIHAQLQAGRTEPFMGPVKTRFDEINRWAKAFVLGPALAAAGAVGLAIRERRGKDVK